MRGRVLCAAVRFWRCVGVQGGEPDLQTAAKMVLHDWQRGKIPFFTLPPATADERKEALPADALEKAGDAVLAAAEENIEGEGRGDEGVTDQGQKGAGGRRGGEGGVRVEGRNKQQEGAIKQALLEASLKQLKAVPGTAQGFFDPEDEQGEDSEGGEEGEEEDQAGEGEEEEEEDGADAGGSSEEGGEESEEEEGEEGGREGVQEDAVAHGPGDRWGAPLSWDAIVRGVTAEESAVRAPSGAGEGGAAEGEAAEAARPRPALSRKQLLQRKLEAQIVSLRERKRPWSGPGSHKRTRKKSKARAESQHSD